jgi:hypothetical protein
MYEPPSNVLYTSYVGIEFKGDSLYSLLDGVIRNDGKFVFRNDSLIYGAPEESLVAYRVQFKEDSMFLFSGNTQMRFHARRTEFDPSLVFNEIHYSGDPVFASRYESIEMTFTGDGKLVFQGHRKHKTKKKTFYVNKIAKTRFDSLFKWTYPQVVDTSHYYGREWDTVISLRIRYNTNQNILVRGSLFSMPYRLSPIISFLLSETRRRDLR